VQSFRRELDIDWAFLNKKSKTFFYLGPGRQNTESGYLKVEKHLK